MSNYKTIKKYEKALDIILFCAEANPSINLTHLRKELKINKNIIRAMQQLGIIKNIGTRRATKYIVLKKFTPELSLQVLNRANKISKNTKQSIIEKHFGDIKPKRTFLQRFFDLFKF